MVHRPFRLAEIIYTLKQYKLEPKRMRLVHPYIDKEPNMVLIEALKGGNSRVTVEPPLIVYKEPGVYTENILKIYAGKTKLLLSQLKDADAAVLGASALGWEVKEN